MVGPRISQCSGQHGHGIERRGIGLPVQLLPGIQKEPGPFDLPLLIAVHLRSEDTAGPCGGPMAGS